MLHVQVQMDRYLNNILDKISPTNWGEKNEYLN